MVWRNNYATITTARYMGLVSQLENNVFIIAASSITWNLPPCIFLAVLIIVLTHPFWRQLTSLHIAATAMLCAGDNLFRMSIHGIRRSTKVQFWSQLIKPHSSVCWAGCNQTHAERLLFFWQWLHSCFFSIETRFVECRTNSCPANRFSHMSCGAPSELPWTSSRP